MSQVIERHFVQALPTDNPHLSAEYIEVLKDNFAHRPNLLEAYLYGSWDSLEGFEQVIKDIWIRAASDRVYGGDLCRKIIACDTARFGDDLTVMDYMENSDIVEQAVLPYCPTTQISNKLAAMSVKYDDCLIVVESTGADLGAAVYDELVALKRNVIEFCPQGQAENPKLFGNLRAEAWSQGAKKLCLGVFDDINSIPFTVSGLDKDTRAQLCWPHYRYRNSKTLIEPKADIKKRLGHSPDHADTYIIGLWGQQFVDPGIVYSESQRTGRVERKSAMAM